MKKTHFFTVHPVHVFFLSGATHFFNHEDGSLVQSVQFKIEAHMRVAADGNHDDVKGNLKLSYKNIREVRSILPQTGGKTDLTTSYFLKNTGYVSKRTSLREIRSILPP